jgi:hypothetical protein
LPNHPKYKNNFPLSQLPKSLVAAVTGGLFCRNFDYKPILFKFQFFEFRQLFKISVFGYIFFKLKIPSSYFFTFHVSAGKFQFSRLRFSRFCWQVPTFTPLLFKFLLASSNFHASAFGISCEYRTLFLDWIRLRNFGTSLQ